MKRDAYPIETEVTDPKLDSLLDEALSPFEIPGGIPNDLTERLVSATVGRLPGGASRGVIGRIGLWGRLAGLGGLGRIAAVLVLVASIVGALVVWSNMGDGGPEVRPIASTGKALDKESDKDKALEGVLEDEVAAATADATVDDEVGPIDTALDQLEVDIELAVSSTTTSWEELADELEAGLAMLDSDF